MTELEGPGGIFVLAGTNGAGKSSVAGALIRSRGLEVFDPDRAMRRILEEKPELGPEAAAFAAWRRERVLFERAIEEKGTFAFETTLSGHAVPRLLIRAAGEGIPVRMWYVGLKTAANHVKRVQSRVRAGGHPVSEERIRHRFDRSRENLVRLLPFLTELWLVDNSHEADPKEDHEPRLLRILHLHEGEVQEIAPLSRIPRWVKPILAVVLGNRLHPH